MEFEEPSEEYKESLKDILDHQVIDGKVYLSADGLNRVLEMQATLVVESIENGLTCQHGAAMAEYLIGGLEDIVQSCIYVRAGDIVPDIIPDDIMGV
jgi:hypothetical protein